MFKQDENAIVSQLSNEYDLDDLDCRIIESYLQLDASKRSISHAIDNIIPERVKYVVQKEVAISQVFSQNLTGLDLFYSGRFDFVAYERRGRDKQMPMFAIELDGKEHFDNETVMARDRKKMEICKKHSFELIRIENSYARRYQYIKDILISFFTRI